MWAWQAKFVSKGSKICKYILFSYRSRKQLMPFPFYKKKGESKADGGGKDDYLRWEPIYMEMRIWSDNKTTRSSARLTQMGLWCVWMGRSEVGNIVGERTILAAILEWIEINKQNWVRWKLLHHFLCLLVSEGGCPILKVRFCLVKFSD